MYELSFFDDAEKECHYSLLYIEVSFSAEGEADGSTPEAQQLAFPAAAAKAKQLIMKDLNLAALRFNRALHHVALFLRSYQTLDLGVRRCGHDFTCHEEVNKALTLAISDAYLPVDKQKVGIRSSVSCSSHHHSRQGHDSLPEVWVFLLSPTESKICHESLHSMLLKY